MAIKGERGENGWLGGGDCAFLHHSYSFPVLLLLSSARAHYTHVRVIIVFPAFKARESPPPPRARGKLWCLSQARRMFMYIVASPARMCLVCLCCFIVSALYATVSLGP